MHAKLINPSGNVKEVKVGFSWTTFFFSCFVPLLRGDFLWALIMFVAALAISAITMGYGTIIFSIAMGLLYNKIYTKGLIKKGYAPASETDEQTLRSKGYLD